MWTKPEAMWEENSSGEQSGQGDRSKTPKCNQKNDSFGNTVDLSIKCLVKDCHELSLPVSLAITWFWSDPTSRAPTWQVEGDWLKVTLPLVLFISRSWLPPPYSSQTRESTIGSVTSVRSFLTHSCAHAQEWVIAMLGLHPGICVDFLIGVDGN